MAFGIVATLNGIISLVVAAKHKRCLLLTYTIAAFAVFLVQAFILGSAIDYIHWIDRHLEGFLFQSINDSYEGAVFHIDERIDKSTEPFSIAWDNIMSRFQ